MKRLTVALFCVFLLFSLAACGNEKEMGSEISKETDGEIDKETDGEINGETDGEINGETDGEIDKETDGEINGETDGEIDKETDNGINEETDDGYTDTQQFLKAMDDLCVSGDQLLELGLTLQAASYYAFAGASVSALRYAVEYLLWLKGEGETLDALTADSRYTGWDTIASVCYASPYTYYFEGLVYHVQGKEAEAKEAYTSTLYNPAYPTEGVNFYYLKSKEVTELYMLRDELRQKEEAIYSKYAPQPIKLERDPYLFDTAYLRAKSTEAVEAEAYAAAASYGRVAVQNDPLDVENFKLAALCCIFNEEMELAALYLDEGLLLAPDEEGLNTIYQSFEQIVGGGA